MSVVWQILSMIKDFTDHYVTSILTRLLNAKGKTPYNCVTEARDAAAAHIFEGGYTL